MKIDEKNIVNIIAFAPLLVVPAFILIVIIFVIHINNENFDKTLKNITSDLKASQQATVKAKVDDIVDLAAHQNSLIIDNLTSRVKDRVETAHKIAKALYEQYKEEKTDQEIKDLISTTLRPIASKCCF